MQEEMDFTPEALQRMEPPEEALVQVMEPVDKPINCSEVIFLVVTLLFVSTANIFAWPPLHTIALGIGSCYVAFELFQLFIPPRFSLARVSLLCILIFGAKLFWK